VKIVLTGATGVIGRRLVRALSERGDDVLVLSRDPARASSKLGVEAAAWDPSAGPAPAEALSGRDAVVHLAGENIAQRWSDAAKQRIRDSRVTGTRNLVAGLRAADPRPRVLVSASGVDYYGPHADETVTEADPAGSTFLAEVCVAWETEAQAAEELGLRVVRLRTGPVLDASGGALATMLPPFKLGAGGPVAGGRQYMAWIHADDLVALYLAALDDERFTAAFNAVAPEPVTNKEFSKALGRALHRPAIAPVPAFALRLLYGDMAEIVTQGLRAVPARAQELGFSFAHPSVDEALRDALA
jgi:uncharacterized protein